MTGVSVWEEPKNLAADALMEIIGGADLREAPRVGDLREAVAGALSPDANADLRLRVGVAPLLERPIATPGMSDGMREQVREVEDLYRRVVPTFTSTACETIFGIRVLLGPAFYSSVTLAELIDELRRLLMPLDATEESPPWQGMTRGPRLTPVQASAALDFVNRLLHFRIEDLRQSAANPVRAAFERLVHAERVRQDAREIQRTHKTVAGSTASGEFRDHLTGLSRRFGWAVSDLTKIVGSGWRDPPELTLGQAINEVLGAAFGVSPDDVGTRLQRDRKAVTRASGLAAPEVKTEIRKDLRSGAEPA